MRGRKLQTALLGASLGLAFWSLLILVLVAAGCGSAMTDTLKAEDALAVTTSQVAHAIDGADALLEAKTRTQMATDQAGAKASYAGYKPKIEKARLAVHTAQDVVNDAEQVRARIPSSDGGTCAAGCVGTSGDFTAWLPAMAKALSALEKAYSDLKGLVRK